MMTICVLTNCQAPGNGTGNVNGVGYPYPMDQVIGTGYSNK